MDNYVNNHLSRKESEDFHHVLDEKELYLTWKKENERVSKPRTQWMNKINLSNLAWNNWEVKNHVSNKNGDKYIKTVYEILGIWKTIWTILV